MRTVSFQPCLVRTRRHRRAQVGGDAVVLGHLERLPGQDLDVHQVEVDGVGVAGEVGDLPDLGGAIGQ